MCITGCKRLLGALCCSVLFLGLLACGTALRDPANGSSRTDVAIDMVVPGLAAPDEVAAAVGRSCSALLQVHEGHEYVTSLAQNVYQSPMNMRAATYAPGDTGSKQFANAAFAGYSFNMAGYDGGAYLKFTWLEPPAAANAWIALSNWQRNRWDWYRMTNASHFDIAEPGFARYAKPTGDPQEGLVLAVVLILGDQPCRLLRLQAGDYQPQWIHSWGQDTEQTFTSICTDPDGNSYYTGTAELPGPPTGTYGVPLVMLDLDGYMLWNAVWQGPESYIGAAITRSSGGDVLICGTDGKPGDLASKLLLLKVSSLGEVTWAKTWNSAGGIKAHAIAVDSDGKPVVVGSLGNKAIVLKFNTDGSIFWQKTWGGTGSDEAVSVAVDTNGDVVFTGMTSPYGGGEDVCLVRLTMGGNLVWSRVWDCGGTEHGNSVALDSAGTSYIAGLCDVPSINSALLLSYSSSGALQIHRGFNAGGLTEANGVALTSDGVYLTGVHAGTGHALCHILLEKYDLTGMWQFARLFGTLQTGVFYGNGIAADSAGLLHIGGTLVPNAENGWAGNEWFDALESTESNTGPGTELQDSGILANATGTMSDVTGMLLPNFGVEDTQHLFSSGNGLMMIYTP